MQRFFFSFSNFSLKRSNRGDPVQPSLYRREEKKKLASPSLAVNTSSVSLAQHIITRAQREWDNYFFFYRLHVFSASLRGVNRRNIISELKIGPYNANENNMNSLCLSVN